MEGNIIFSFNQVILDRFLGYAHLTYLNHSLQNLTNIIVEDLLLPCLVSRTYVLNMMQQCSHGTKAENKDTTYSQKRLSV